MSDPDNLLLLGVFVAGCVMFALFLGVLGYRDHVARVTYKGPVPEFFVARGVRVIDGDTVRLLYTEQWVSVRLRGIDAPELDQCTLPVGWTRTRIAIGRNARLALVELVDGDQVSCAVFGRDRYGRVIGVLSTEQVPDVNETLVRHGWAVAYTRYDGEIYLAAQEEAQAARRGIWRYNEFWVKPEAWRRIYGGR